MPLRHSWTLALLLACGLAQAETPQPVKTPTNIQFDMAPDDDGFKHPLDALKFNPGLDQREFERATFDALNVYDPWESWNRRVYHFNYRFDDWVFLPVVHGYEYVTPRFVRTGVSNFFSNLGEVTTLLNNVGQLKPERAANSTARLLFNTILGIGGLWDPASAMGLPKISEDFGQTLGYWGVESGPYLVIPFLGPSTVRDAGGKIPDAFLEPYPHMDHVPTRNVTRAVDVVDTRASLLSAEKLISGDKYIFIRNAYLQNREFKVKDGEVEDDF